MGFTHPQPGLLPTPSTCVNLPDPCSRPHLSTKSDSEPLSSSSGRGWDIPRAPFTTVDVSVGVARRLLSCRLESLCPDDSARDALLGTGTHQPTLPRYGPPCALLSPSPQAAGPGPGPLSPSACRLLVVEPGLGWAWERAGLWSRRELR